MSGLTVTRRGDRIIARCGCARSEIALGYYFGDSPPSWLWLVLAFVLGGLLGFLLGVML